MINCTHCNSNVSVNCKYNQNGIEEEYFCDSCGCTHIKHSGIFVTDYGNKSPFNISKLLEMYL